MENNEQKEQNNEENVIVTPMDFGIPLHDRGYEPTFYCPKCNSSLMCLAPEYTKNNVINQMEEKKDDNPDTLQLNIYKDTKWMKLILKCDACKYIDIIMKFLREKPRPEYDTIAPSYPRPYPSTGVYKPYTISTASPSSGWFSNKKKRYNNAIYQGSATI